MTDVRYRHLGRGSEPRDPAPLRWPEEPGFEAARVAVLQNRAHEVTLVISNQTDISVRGELSDRLKRLGLNLGAGTDRSESSTLHLVAKFPDFGNGRRR